MTTVTGEQQVIAQFEPIVSGDFTITVEIDDGVTIYPGLTYPGLTYAVPAGGKSREDGP